MTQLFRLKHMIKMGRISKILVFICICTVSYAQNKPKFGAYYFDGWTGRYPQHITKELTTSFSNREPKWGWITSKKKIMNEQIDMAVDAGLSFFSFCWYYSGPAKYESEPLNNSLKNYLSSPGNSKLGFSIMVANHYGFEVGPESWDFVCSEWIKYFKHPSYVTTGKKPLLIFFTYQSLVKNFGGEGAVKTALDTLRSRANAAGIPGVAVAVCVNSASKSEISTAERCGFDILTGYNYHTAGYGNGLASPIDSLTSAESKLWTKISANTSLRYIPVTTLNWDPRPWVSQEKLKNTKYYQGLSTASVYKSVSTCAKWLNGYGNTSASDQIALIYAWNENGEGAYLTPSKNGERLLNGVKRALVKTK